MSAPNNSNLLDEEYERQFRYIQALKTLEFYSSKEIESFDEPKLVKEKSKMSSAKMSSAKQSFRHPSQASFDEDSYSINDECKYIFEKKNEK
jgi:hypothetical protein